MPSLRKPALPPLLAILVCLVLGACTLGPAELRIYALNHPTLDARALRSIFAEKSKIRISTAQVIENESALQSLLNNHADLALINNSTPFSSGIRAILPVYESVLHLLARSESRTPADIFELREKKVFIVNQSLAGQKFIQLVAQRQELKADDFELLNAQRQDEADFIIYFGPIDPSNLNWYQEGYQLISLDSRTHSNRKLLESGVGYVLPQMKGETIPSFTYPLPGNRFDIQTVSVDTLLVTRKEVPEKVIYEFTRALLEEKPRFTAIAPSLFAGINESFDPLQLSFPLHQGARRYLERDEPSLLERYAETINLLVYLVFLSLTGFAAAARWRAHRKKDRIDTFYMRVFGIREQSTGENHEELRQQLRALEEEAFASLISEKLAANESFRIFVDLLNRTYKELGQERQKP